MAILFRNIVGFVNVISCVAIYVAIAPLLADEPQLGTLRLNQVQLVGTHNSYHLAPDDFARSMIAAVTPKEADAIDCSLPTLTEQLSALNIRHFELDLYLDPKGVLFHSPAAWRLAKQQRADVPVWDFADKMRQPGIKILHSPDFDYRSTVATFRDALQEFSNWSKLHPRHVPLFILLELKSDSFSPMTRPLPWGRNEIDDLEAEILKVIPREQIVAPDDVRGDREALRDAVRNIGWPTLESVRGKFVFLLDNEGGIRDLFLARSQTLAGSLLFVSVSADHPAAAWMKRNDPVGQYGEIVSLVEQGFLVRTRADANTVEARVGDTSRRDKAIASGAQLISTDFPTPDQRFSDYSVKLAFPFENR